jgi:hypothetical protein
MLRRGVRPARGTGAPRLRTNPVLETGPHRSALAIVSGSVTRFLHGLVRDHTATRPNRNYEGPARNGAITCEELTQDVFLH